MSAAYKRAMQRQEDNEWRALRRLSKSLADMATKQTLDDVAPNKIDYGTRLAIHRLAHEGKGVRAISRELRISPNTVDRYFPRDAACACGRLLISHPAWCAVRYAASKVRQNTMQKLHNAQRPTGSPQADGAKDSEAKSNV